MDCAIFTARMRRSLFAGIACSTAAWSSAMAQSAPLLAFDPLPVAIPEDEGTLAAHEATRAVIENKLLIPQIFVGATAKVWRKAHGDGYIVCINTVKTAADDLTLIAGVSLSTGPFKTVSLRNIWNEDQYNLFGCNTPNGITVKVDYPSD